MTTIYLMVTVYLWTHLVDWEARPSPESLADMYAKVDSMYYTIDQHPWVQEFVHHHPFYLSIVDPGALTTDGSMDRLTGVVMEKIDKIVDIYGSQEEVKGKWDDIDMPYLDWHLPIKIAMINAPRVTFDPVLVARAWFLDHVYHILVGAVVEELINQLVRWLVMNRYGPYRLRRWLRVIFRVPWPSIRAGWPLFSLNRPPPPPLPPPRRQARRPGRGPAPAAVYRNRS